MCVRACVRACMHARFGVARQVWSGKYPSAQGVTTLDQL